MGIAPVANLTGDAGREFGREREVDGCMNGFVVSKGPELEAFACVFPVRFFVGEPPKEMLFKPDNTEGVKGVLGVLPTSERVRCLLGVFGKNIEKLKTHCRPRLRLT